MLGETIALIVLTLFISFLCVSVLDIYIKNFVNSIKSEIWLHHKKLNESDTLLEVEKTMYKNKEKLCKKIFLIIWIFLFLCTFFIICLYRHIF